MKRCIALVLLCPKLFSHNAATVFLLTFLSFSVVSLVIETRFAFLNPGKVSPRKKIKFFLVTGPEIS